MKRNDMELFRAKIHHIYSTHSHTILTTILTTRLTCLCQDTTGKCESVRQIGNLGQQFASLIHIFQWYPNINILLWQAKTVPIFFDTMAPGLLLVICPHCSPNLHRHISLKIGSASCLYSTTFLITKDNNNQTTTHDKLSYAIMF